MNLRNKLIGKHCKTRFKNGFTLTGKVVHMNDEGFFFQTPQKTSFISFDKITELIPIDNNK